jgi:hypothetical protein
MTTLATDLAAIGELMDSLYSQRECGLLLQVKVVQGIPTYLFRSEVHTSDAVRFQQADTLVQWLSSITTRPEDAASPEAAERLARMRSIQETLATAVAALEETIEVQDEEAVQDEGNTGTDEDGQ